MRWWRVPVPPRPLRSCKDQMHPCALPVMVSRVSAALTSSAFQTDAFTGLAFWTANCATRAVSQDGADQRNRTAINARAAHGTPNIPGPRSCRRMVGNRGIEPRMRKGAGFTGPLSHQTWRYPNVSKACCRSEAVRWQAAHVLIVDPGHHDRTRTYILDLRMVVLIQLSYVVITAGHSRRLIFRARHPSTGSRARSRAGSSAGTVAARP